MTGRRSALVEGAHNQMDQARPPRQITTALTPLIGHWSTPDHGTRLPAAWAAVVPVLADGRYHTFGELSVLMVEVGQVQSKTAKNLLDEAWRYGVLLRRDDETPVRNNRRRFSYIVSDWGLWDRPELQP